MDKSADAFRTISEVAEDLILPQHVLRFWESKFPQIKPLKRAGGRRYYRPADVGLLRSIRRLLYDDGYTIKGVQRLLKDRGVRNLDGLPPIDAGASPFDDADDLSAVGGTPAGDAMNDEAADAGMADMKPRSAGPDAAQWSATGDLAALRSALTSIEECERILAAVRAPPP